MLHSERDIRMLKQGLVNIFNFKFSRDADICWDFEVCNCIRSLNYLEKKTKTEKRGDKDRSGTETETRIKRETEGTKNRARGRTRCPPVYQISSQRHLYLCSIALESRWGQPLSVSRAKSDMYTFTTLNCLGSVCLLPSQCSWSVPPGPVRAG